MATGASFQDLHFHFMRGATTIGAIVNDVCEQLWLILQPLYMPILSKNDWIVKASEFLNMWNLPNCLGSIDGKHVRVKCPSNSGSAFYNYKGFFSVVLMAVSDANGNFCAVDVGDYGRNSDGSVFKHSSFGRLLANEQLNLPSTSTLPNDEGTYEFPYYFVADAAFPLCHRIMRPYPTPGQDMKKRIFNYRLSRARRTVECSFGMLTSKFRVFERPINCEVPKCVKIVKAACVLHNFIRVKETLINNDDDSITLSLQNLRLCNTRCTRLSQYNRDYLAHYLSYSYTLPWQQSHC